MCGAGKTTLMNTLAGKASYGKRRGLIQVNGQPDSLDNFTRVMGFVPQVGPASNMFDCVSSSRKAVVLSFRMLLGGMLAMDYQNATADCRAPHCACWWPTAACR